MWRVRSFFGLLLLYFLWVQGLRANPEIAGYSEGMILSYIFIANFLQAFVLSNRTDQISADILSGSIINQLLMPVNFFTNIGAREFADKTMNMIFSVIEIVIFILLFKPQLYFHADPLQIVMLLAFMALAVCLSFFISFILSMVAFWSADIWAPRFIFMIFSSFMAGTMFPLDIFPKQIYDVFMLTPFPYLIYVPAQIAVKGVTPEVVQFAVIGCLWLGFFAFVAKYLWRKGLREFSFIGR